MEPGLVLRGNEQDEHVNRLAVEAVKANAWPRQGHGADQSIDTGVLGMRDGDSAADAGGAEQLSFEDGPDNVFRVGPLELASGPRPFDHLAYHPLLGGGRQL